MKNAVDVIALELFWTRMISIVDEAAATMVRTSFSTNVRESNDFACVLADEKGYSLAQATHSIPSFLGTVPRTIRHFIDAFPIEEMTPGDVFITNDIWLGTGHLPDITVARPIFLDGQVVAWAGSVAHSPDIGGRIRSADAREVFEEGFQIPMMKVMTREGIDPLFELILRKNVRVPDQVIGDLYAQFNAIAQIDVRVADLMRQQGVTNLRDIAREIHDRSERAMRQAIRDIPDGVYKQVAFSDGIDAPIRLEMALTVDGDSISVDFAGTDPQVMRSINVCYAYTAAYTGYGVRTVLLPDVPGNEGVLRPVSVHAPEGSILNALPPAAGGARALIGHFLPMMVVRALAEALPERVMATVGSPLWCVNLTGRRDDGSQYANMFFLNGGYGASHHRDGVNVLSWPSNISSTPIEVIEHLSPLRVKYRRLREDGGGAGKFRGGTGQEMCFESRSDTPFTVSFMAERTKKEAAPTGLAGGLPGQPGVVLINGQPVEPKAQHLIGPGGTVELRTPGGGGFGDPAQRPADLHQKDVRDGYVSA